MKEYLNKIPKDKYKITYWNKFLITMDNFKSFLNVDLIKIKNHLGSSTGWTKYKNEEHELYITGGIYEGIEYFHDVQYKKNLDNVWNNYVNPFYLDDIINNKGIDFFLKYYANGRSNLIIFDGTTQYKVHPESLNIQTDSGEWKSINEIKII